MAEYDGLRLQVKIVAFRLESHCGDNRIAQSLVVDGVGPHHAPQIHRVLLPEAEQQPSLRSQPNPVALIAEVVAVGRYETYAGLLPGDAVVTGGSTRRLGGGDHFIPLAQVGQNPVAGVVGLGTVVLLDEPKRHLFDETDVEPFCDGEADQIQHLVMVTVFKDHGVEFDTFKVGRYRCVDAGEGFGYVSITGNGMKPVRLQRVDADIDALHAGAAQCVGIAGQLGAVGGQGQFSELIEPAQLIENLHDIVARQRFTAGYAYLLYAQVYESLTDAYDLFQREQLGARYEADILGHAVDAAQVTAVCYRYADVIYMTPKSIDQACLLSHSKAP